METLKLKEIEQMTVLPRLPLESLSGRHRLDKLNFCYDYAILNYLKYFNCFF